MAKNSAGVEMSQRPPSVHPTAFPRGSGYGRVVKLPSAADINAQSAVVGVTEVVVGDQVIRRLDRVDIRGTRAGRKPGRARMPWRVSDAEELGQPRKWKFTCSVEGCPFYSHHSEPADKHETKTGHAVLRGGGQ